VPDWALPGAPAQTTTEPSKPATPLMRPELISELRQGFKDARITGDAATAFCKATIGRETPGSDHDAHKLIDNLRAITPDRQGRTDERPEVPNTGEIRRGQPQEGQERQPALHDKPRAAHK
jgi:hypothetical protein